DREPSREDAGPPAVDRWSLPRADPGGAPAGAGRMRGAGCTSLAGAPGGARPVSSTARSWSSLRAEEPARAPRPEVREEVRLSFAQEDLWFLHQLYPGNPAYNVAVALRARGVLDTAALQRSLTEITRRHAALRTRFASRGGRPVQIAEPPQPVSLPVVVLDCAGGFPQALRLARQEGR